MDVVGQLTPPKNPPPLVIREFQVRPLSDVRRISPKSPTATQDVVVAQLIPLMAVEMPVDCIAQFVPPFVVARMRPSVEPAKQVVVLGQLIPCTELPSGRGFCQLQVPRVIGARGPNGLSRGFD
jgi:hypothetical protein